MPILIIVLLVIIIFIMNTHNEELEQRVDELEDKEYSVYDEEKTTD